MSELTLFLVRVAYLAILWIFVLGAISVIRSDMFGARVPETARGGAPAPQRKGNGKPRKPRRGAPTHLLVVEGAEAGARAELADAPLLIGRGNRRGIGTGMLAGSALAFNTHTLTRLAHIQGIHIYGLPLALLAIDRLISPRDVDDLGAHTLHPTP